MTQSIRTLRSALLVISVMALFGAAAPAHADSTHHPRRAGHPLRLVAYVLHPLGYLIDTVVMRPLHWVASRDGIDEVVGHTDH